MLGPEEMELADELRLVVLLHVPRAGRLADPVVQAGVRDYAGVTPVRVSSWPTAGAATSPTRCSGRSA